MLNHAESKEREWMIGALELARRGTALASPNPLVGALLVKEGQLVAQGCYTYDGRKHAEVLALEEAQEAARGATLFINLEPCCHVGRTGPCTEAILAAGVKRVVAAMADPNPLVSGQGFERLRQAGVEVETGICQEQAERLNECFTRHIRTGLPLVTLKAAMTLDGKIAAPRPDSTSAGAAPEDPAGRGGWVTGPEARAYVQQQRHAADAILTGVGTIVADDPLLTDRSGLPRRRPLLRVVMDSRLRIPLAARMLAEVDDDVLIFCASAADAAKREELAQRGVQVCALTPDKSQHGSAEEVAWPLDPRPSLREVIRELGRREMTSVLLEAGSELNWTALESDIVDKVFLYYAPKILGGREALPMAGGRGMRAMRDALPVKKIQLHQFGPDFAVEGYLHDVYETVASEQ